MRICDCRIFHRLPSVLWHCWLGGRKGIRPIKTELWGAGVVVCLEQDADLYIAQLMPLPLTVSCFSKIQIGFAFLVPAHPGNPGKRAVNCSFISAKCAYHIFLTHKLAFSTAILCFYCLLLLGFITSTIWLPTEWHDPCVRTPVERDGVVGFKQVCTIFPHIWYLYVVHIFLNAA